MNYVLVHGGHNKWRDLQGKCTKSANIKVFLGHNKLDPVWKNINKSSSQSIKKMKFTMKINADNKPIPKLTKWEKSHIQKNKTDILRYGE